VCSERLQAFKEILLVHVPQVAAKLHDVKVEVFIVIKQKQAVSSFLTFTTCNFVAP